MPKKTFADWDAFQKAVEDGLSQETWINFELPFEPDVTYIPYWLQMDGNFTLGELRFIVRMWEQYIGEDHA